MKKVLIVDAEPWSVASKKIVRLSDILQENFEKNPEIFVERVDIKPNRTLGYFNGYFTSAICAFRKIFFKDFDVLFIPNCYLSFLTVISKIKNKKSVVIYTDIYPEFIRKVKKEGLKFLALLIVGKIFSKITDKVVIPSVNEIKIGKLIGIPESKIHMIRNPVDTTCIRFDPTQRKKIRNMFKLNDRVVIGYVGKLIKYYRVDKVIKAIALLPSKKRNKIIFLLVGEGPERERLKKLAKRLHVKVKDVGFIPHEEIYKFYSAMDLFIYPIDAIGIKLNEVMCVGIPVIISRGIAEEIIIDGENGILVEAPEPEFFAKKIEYFMNLKKTQIKKIRENMRKYAMKNISAKSVIKMYESLIL
jgi:glycosyltransferase involved in cell wall biosynthesis